MLRFVPIETVDPAAVDALLDRAFGSDRRTKTAYRLRDRVNPIPDLSFGAVEGGALIGSIQCWPVEIAGDGGGIWPLVLVGPVAVDPARQRAGLGKDLMRRSLDAASTAGLDRAMMLVGDPEYYGRFWGFSANPTGGWRLPGPVDRHRLLARGPDVPAICGMVGPRTAAVAA